MNAKQRAPRGRRRRRGFLLAVAAAAVLLPVTTVNLLLAEPTGRRFTDVATPGLADPEARSEGSCFADMEGDGDIDLFVSRRERPGHLWRNDGGGVFTEISAPSGLHETAHLVTGCAWVDLNEDGFPDLFLSVRSRNRNVSNKLLRNNGDGTFANVTDRANVTMVRTAAASSDWADYDGDGDLDGFVAARQGQKGYINALLTQVAPFTFRNDARAMGVAEMPKPFSFMGSWFDYDQDGDVDLLIAIDFWGLELFRNDGGSFTKVTTTALPPAQDNTVGAPPNNPMGITWGDYDNDGCFDVFITGTNMTGQGGFEGDTLGDLASRLYRGNCRGTFADVTKEAGFRPTGVVEWSANFIDFDNDGDLDLSVVAANSGDKVSDNSSLLKRIITTIVGIPRRFIPYTVAAWAYRYEAMIPASGGTGWAGAMPNFLYRNMLVETGKASFVDVTREVGVENVGASQGSAWADIDNDGDLDWFVPSKETPSRLFRNDGPVGQYLWVQLRGRRIREAIGAWVKIKVGSGWQMRHVHILDGYLSQSQMDPHFGLGKATLVDEVWVRWAGSTEWILMCRGVAANRTVTVTEDGGCR